MKKLKLSLANTQATEVLSREQLKKIMGGEEGSGVYTCTWRNKTASPCTGGTSTSTCDGQNLKECQDAADILCQNISCCSDVTCK